MHYFTNKKLYFPFSLKNVNIKYKTPLNALQGSMAESTSNQVYSKTLNLYKQ